MKLHALAATSRASTELCGPSPAIRKAVGPHIGVQRGRPVVEHTLALANARIVGEEALNVVFDWPLPPEHRGRHLQIVAAIARNQRQIAAADPDGRPDRVADAHDYTQSHAVRIRPGRQQQPEYDQYRSNREMPANQNELGWPADRRHERNLVELVGDCVESRCDPAVPHVEPSASRRPRLSSTGQGGASDRSVPPSPYWSLCARGTLCDRSAPRTIMVSPP